MPPARPRVLEDTRSETSHTNIRDRAATGTAMSRSKKIAASSLNVSLSAPKAVMSSGSTTAAAVTSTGAANAEQESPHVRHLTVVSVVVIHLVAGLHLLRLLADYSCRSTGLISPFMPSTVTAQPTAYRYPPRTHKHMLTSSTTRVIWHYKHLHKY